MQCSKHAVRMHVDCNAPKLSCVNNVTNTCQTCMLQPQWKVEPFTWMSSVKLSYRPEVSRICTCMHMRAQFVQGAWISYGGKHTLSQAYLQVKKNAVQTQQWAPHVNADCNHQDCYVFPVSTSMALNLVDCVYACMHVETPQAFAYMASILYTRIYTSVHTYIHSHIHIYTYTCTYTYTYTDIRTDSYTHTQLCEWQGLVHTHTYTALRQVHASLQDKTTKKSLKTSTIQDSNACSYAHTYRSHAYTYNIHTHQRERLLPSQDQAPV